MRTAGALIVSLMLVLAGCAAGGTATTPRKKSSQLSRESVRKHFGTHYELAMILDASDVVQRKLRQEISGNKGIHPGMENKFDILIASFNASKVQSMLSIVLKDHFTDQEAIALSDHFSGSAGQAAVKPVAELLVEFEPRKPGPAPAMKKALGPFAQKAVGKKWVQESPRVQSEFTEMILQLTIVETKGLLGKGGK